MEDEVVQKKRVITRGKGVSNERPRRVARKVITALQMGEKPMIGKILASEGYSPSVQKSPTQVTKSPAFKDEFDSYVARLEKERTRVLGAMEKKPLDEVDYKDLVEAGKKMTHDVQLLTGGRTENRGVEEDRNTLVMIMREIRGELPEGPIPGEVISISQSETDQIVNARREIDGEVPGASQAV